MRNCSVSKAAAVLLLGPLFAVSNAVRADDASTAATLSCVPAAVANPATAPPCLVTSHTQLEIAKCIGAAPGSCFGRNNEVRKVGRWIDKNLTRRITRLFR